MKVVGWYCENDINVGIVILAANHSSSISWTRGQFVGKFVKKIVGQFARNGLHYES